MTGTGGGLANFSTTEHWIDLGMVCLCILSAGLAAGLTIGLISIDRNELRLMSINGTEEQKKQAAKILPLIKDHHWLLVTLFLFNATANEALPVFLTGLVPEYAAIVYAALPRIPSSLNSLPAHRIAAFSVLVFGEILPSSIFSGEPPSPLLPIS
jgi:metal transporter CNNM